MSFTMSGVFDAWSPQGLKEGSCQGYQKGGEVKKDNKECEECKKAGKKKCECSKEPRWQDSDGDGKWYEKGEDVAESYDELDEAAKDQSDKQLEKGMKTTYKAQGEIANADYNKYPDGKEGRMLGRLKDRRKDIMDTQHDRNMKKLQDLQKAVDLKKKTQKEELEATGLFSEEEIDAITEKLA